MILDAIFDGQIYPSETVVPKCKAFWEANEAATNIMSYFEQKLSKEDYEKLERLNDRLADSQNIQNKEQFKYGFAMGVLLMKEVYEHPEFKPKEYKYHNPYDDWIFRQLADIDNRKNIPNTSPQVDFNKGDYEDYLKAKWNRGL